MITLSDSNGQLGDAATTTGYNDAITHFTDAFKAHELGKLRELFETGKTKNPQDTAIEAAIAARKIKNVGVRSTLSNIAQLLNKAQDFAVVE